MSQDTAPRYSYAVTIEVVLYVEAETEDKAASYAEETFTDAVNSDFIPFWCVAHVERNDA